MIRMDGLILPGTDNFMHRPGRSAGGRFFGEGGAPKKPPPALRAGLRMKSSVPDRTGPYSGSSQSSYLHLSPNY